MAYMCFARRGRIRAARSPRPTPASSRWRSPLAVLPAFCFAAMPSGGGAKVAARAMPSGGGARVASDAR
eukprot:4091452-Pyramimonas_sp.AAC.1